MFVNFFLELRAAQVIFGAGWVGPMWSWAGPLWGGALVASAHRTYTSVTVHMATGHELGSGVGNFTRTYLI